MTKKILAIVLLPLLIATGCIYLFIPGTLVINNVAALQCSVSGANRVLLQKENWKKFWRGDVHTSPQSSFGDADFFTYNKYTFRVTKLLPNTLKIAIADDEASVSSTLQILPLPNDSIMLSWNYLTHTSANPFTRIRQYQHAVQTKENMTTVLSSIKEYLSKNENIYGFAIGRTSTIDTSLISTKTTLNTYPTNGEIYSLIDKLQAYARESGAVQTGYPMLNITQTEEQHYVVMTALPVNKILPGKNDISYKRMIAGGFLTATVTGGEATVDRAYNQLGQYFQDYRHTAMAIPFMYLITDRRKETDTSRWVTKLYFPAM